MEWHRIRRDPWVWGQFVLIAVVAALPLVGPPGPEDGAWALLRSPEGPARRAGLVPLVLGAVVALAAVRRLGPNLTPATTPMKNASLIQDGIYERIRHPIYTGVIAGLWGWAWLANGWRVGLAVLAVSLLYFDRKAASEERKLLLRFPEYAAYRRRVGKLLPRLRA